ncbi:MAG: hypothetical protein NVS3B20_06640 [Polyangiales bacterium]
MRYARSGPSHVPEGQGRERGRMREAVDIFVGGVNVTARVQADQAPCILRDLAFAVVDLACGVRRRAIVRFYDGPWELGLERIDVSGEGAAVSFTVVRNGEGAEVAVYDRRILLSEAIRGTIAALDTVLADGRSRLAEVLEGELGAARDALGRLSLDLVQSSQPAQAPRSARIAQSPDGSRVTFEGDATEEVLVVAEPEPGLRCALGGELPLRVSRSVSEQARGVEVADVHTLLGRGHLKLLVRGRTVDLGEVHTFLAAERAIVLGARVLEAWERGRGLQTRVDLGGPILHVKLEEGGALTLSVTKGDVAAHVASAGEAIPKETEANSIDEDERVRSRLANDRNRATEDRATMTLGEVIADPSHEVFGNLGRTIFTALEGPDLIDAVISFTRVLVRTILRRDRLQARNLRLMALRRRVRELSDRLRDVALPVGPCGDADLINPRRDSYRPYLKQAERFPARSLPEGSRRLRYEPLWTAEVPGIDLRATFLCGDRLILSGASQTACVDRVDGRTLWKVPTVRATSLPTAGGLARLRGDGRLELRDFGTGATVWSQPCAPRSKGTPAACTIVAPGLPRLLVATDGDRHLVAFDLTSGEPRWRYALSRPGPIRIRRAGRLLVISSDEAQLMALDAVEGHLVWRVRDRLRFAGPATIEREDLMVIAGEPSGPARLHLIDAPSGTRRYERPLEEAVAIDTAPLLIDTVCVVVTRDRRGLGLLAIDRASGVERWRASSGTWPIGTSALGLNHLEMGIIVLNLPTGEVLAVSAQTGETLWRHVFESPFLGDAPRRLEPILRSGALFVPQDKVRVLRPSDGAIVGEVGPTELVPDLLRVDERCDVYIAEESGHVAAFGASAKLEVISGERRGVPRGKLTLVRGPIQSKATRDMRDEIPSRDFPE